MEEVRAGYLMDWGGVRPDVIALPLGELYSETNDNSVAILLSYATAHVLLAGDVEAREEYLTVSLPSVHARRSRVARHDRRRHPCRVLEGSQFDFDL